MKIAPRRQRRKSEISRPLLQAILLGKLLPGMTFDQKVWAVTARIPPGKVVTYGQIASALGSRGCRAVGAALGRNPYSPRVPCHRVIGADRRLTGFAGGLKKKAAMLRKEGITIIVGRVTADCMGDI